MTMLVDELSQKSRYKSAFTKSQIETVKTFDKRCESERNKETTRRENITKFFQFLSAVDKEFDNINEQDIENFLQQLKDRKLQDNTIETFRFYLKKFFKGTPLENSELLKHVPFKYKYKTSKDMLTEDEVMQMIKVINHPQEKAVIGVLWETGCRVGELCNCNLEDHLEIANKSKIILNGKTGIRERELIISRKFLRNWIEIHPYKDQLDKPLFLSFSHKRFHQRATNFCIAQICNKARKKAGITKRVTPHIFRHSRATYLSSYLTEFEMKSYFGWSRDSNMPGIYIHLSQKDVNSKYESVVTGKKKELMPEPSLLLPKACPWCGEKNEPTVRYCPRCGCRLGGEQEIKAISEEMQLLEIFKTSFGKQIITDYNHLKTQYSLLQRFYLCFNDIHVRKIVEVRQHFTNLTEDQLLEFLGILNGLELIDFVGDRIFLVDREKLIKEIEGSKALISFNSD